MGNYLIKLRDVEVRYNNRNGGLVAITGINLTVSPGEVVGIVGKSGCGKTTLLKVIAGLVKPTRGEVIYNGSQDGEGFRGIGMLFQSPLLLPWRTILRNILLPIELRGEDLDKYVGRALELMERMGLKGFENSYPWELSGGMQQRVALCRALIHRPSLLLLDEPFSSLDAITREEMWVLLQGAISYENYTTILVTHDIREAVLLSDRVIVMGGRPGRIKAEIPIPFRRPRSLELQYSREFNDYIAEIRGLLGD
jgi:NitT/TauT family transport system ATP-binding protein